MHKFLLVALAGLAAAAVAAPAMAQGLGDVDAILGAADTDHDGVITRAEFASARAARLARFDRNHDGVLSMDDFPRLARRGGQRSDGLKRLIEALDLDGDGRVTSDEMLKAPSPLFERADANHDGRLDAGEVAAARAARQAR